MAERRAFTAADTAVDQIAPVLAVPISRGRTERGARAMTGLEAPAPVGVDGRPVVEQIRREIPGVLAWYGRSTGSWWALVPGRDGGLVEAADPWQLREEIVSVRGWPWRR